MKKIVREPLLHFLLLGLVLYAMTAFVKNRTDPSNKIIVDNTTVGNLVSKYMLQTGSPPNKVQLDALINNEIKEQIEYREALRMGLDKDDEIIKRRLSQKLEFLKSDLIVVPQPSKNDLKKFYKEHQKLYRDSTTVSFTHVYLNGERTTSGQLHAKAAAILTELKQQHLSRAPELGDRFPLQYDYTDIDELEAKQLFGDSKLTDTLFKLPVKQWTGLFSSGYGWHLIYVQKNKQGNVKPFEEVKDDVEANYIEFIKQQQNDKQWEKMKAKYTIDRSYLNPKKK